MATTNKPQKEKPRAGKLTPRPTAASAARAARNAINRNLTEPAKAASPAPATPATHTREKRAGSPRSRTRVSPPSPPSKMSYQPENMDNFLIPTVPSSANSYVVDERPSATPLEDIMQTQQPCVDGYDMNCNYDGDANDCKETSREEPCTDDATPRSRLHTPETQTNVKIPVTCSQPETPNRPQTSRSRPHTPAVDSRLAKSLPPSRPQTPRQSTAEAAQAPSSRVSSRPTTPSRKTQSKPPSSTVAPKSKIACSIPVPTEPRNVPQNPIDTVKEEDDIKSVYAAKRKEFLAMKKELDTKQQALLRTYDALRNMTEQLSEEGVEPIEIQDLVVFNVADWTAEEVAQLCRDATESAHSDKALALLDNLNQIDETTVIELDGKISNIPSKFSDLCLQAFTSRQEVIDWVKQIIDQQSGEQGEGHSEYLEKIAQYNSQGHELCDALRTVKDHADSTVSDISQISKMAFLERSILISVGKSLVTEIARLRNDLDAQSSVIEDIKESRDLPETTITANTLQDAQRQLDDERAARVALKDKLSVAETQLRQTRARVAKMDRQLREAEASIISLTATVKSLEDQNRQREVHFEARARKLKESLKTGEMTNTHISQQRDNYQAEVQKLTEQLETTVAQHKSTVHELNKEIKQLKTALEEQVRITQEESEKNKELEHGLMQLRNAFDEYKISHPEIDNNPELPTEREIDLWAELQATKDTLRITEDEVTACKREKVRFLETLTKIAETEDKVGMQQKLAAELLSKEEIIGKMQIQIRELTKNIKLNEQKVIQYEQYVRNLQAHTRAVANCQEAPNGISYEDLQQEIMNLRMNLLDAVHRNEELDELLSQKEQQLEQQDKTSRAQARIIKVREELINMLKNKETEQSKELASLQQDVEYRMKIVEEVNKQIASKAEEIQELFVTLENRQQQIHRLEKIVLALEEQQRRAQVQRTRYEEKIAALEHELSAGVNRERKFLFF